ncbi:phosphate signaling complex protein PhoU [Janthinobacterium sp. 17J80-10]|uniref:phosphate signaling complex protein PhoU n=1 Tax=Janthinobacterium sp. 17J80-10 TaxID=2497863 RepID=UPI0010055E48|nr:phosphate signaling complex protein PhoU [Janthinobacterium sp. 17J80-10]QAU35448.1 phosphate signaling complex protein PhoU [Janthinobacterium sp. 17J80-10]
MNNPHIVKSYDKELQTLASSVGAMGDFAGVQFADAIQSLLAQDSAMAQRVIEQDRMVDALRRDLSAAAANVIARRQPVADDLDEVLAELRIVEDLERIGDLAKNIARRAITIAGEPLPAEITDKIRRLAALTSEQLRNAIDAYIAGDIEKARAMPQDDDEIDALHGDIFADIIALMNARQMQVIGLVHLLFCAKNIERIADHATHIAEIASQSVSTGQARQSHPHA